MHFSAFGIRQGIQQFGCSNSHATKCPRWRLLCHCMSRELPVKSACLAERDLGKGVLPVCCKIVVGSKTWGVTW